jgi:hypothetical protein
MKKRSLSLCKKVKKRAGRGKRNEGANIYPPQLTLGYCKSTINNNPQENTLSIAN